MTVNTLEAPAYRSPFDLEALKARLGISGSASDADLVAIVDEVASAAEVYLCRPLARQTYIEELEGASRFGRLVLSLSRFPVDPDSVVVEVDGAEVTDFEVRDWQHGELWRADGWPTIAGDGDGPIGISAQYAAGYVMPDAFVTWASGADVELGQWVRPPARSRSLLLFEVTEAGELGAEPTTWPTLAGDAVDHTGTAELTGRRALALPAGLAGALFAAVHRAWKRRQFGPGLTSVAAEGFSATFSRDSADAAVLSPDVLAALDAWRWGG